jgi:hypothetical protein
MNFAFSYLTFSNFRKRKIETVKIGYLEYLAYICVLLNIFTYLTPELSAAYNIGFSLNHGKFMKYFSFYR